MDLKTSCHSCGQHVVVDSTAGGSSVHCPSCGTELIIPEIVVERPPPLASNPVVERVCVEAPPHKPRNIGWGVFWGLFGFFILLPLAVICLGLLLYGFSEAGKSSIKTDRSSGRSIVSEDCAKVNIPKDWTWNFVHANDGYLVRIKYPLENGTQYKVKDLKLLVKFYDGDEMLIFKRTLSELTDEGMDFAPPNEIKSCETTIALESMVPASVKKVSLSIEDFKLAAMTALDKRLCELCKINNAFEKSGRENMTPQEEAAEDEFIRLLKQKR